MLAPPGPPAAPVLTPRETEVLQLAADDLSAREIAARLYVSPHTVRTHLNAIYSKLRVHGRAAAVAEGMRFGLIR